MTDIEILRKQEAQLLYLKDMKFKTESEFHIFYEDNKVKFESLRNIQHKIRELEWNVKTPQQKEIVRLEKIKLAQKFEDVNSENAYRIQYVAVLNNLYTELCKTNLEQKDFIYHLASILCYLENEPFAEFEFSKQITKEAEDSIKINSLELYELLTKLSNSKEK